MISTGEDISGEDTLAYLVSETLSLDLAAAELAATLQSQRINHLARLLPYRVATLPEPEAREVCLQLIGRLSVEMADCLLRAPVLCRILRMGDNTSQLVTLLEGEVALEPSAPPCYLERWSALGNIWLGQQVPESPLPLQSRDGRFVGPDLECGIPLDLSLPPFIDRPSAGLKSPRLLTCTETLETIELLNASVDILREVSPIGYQVLTQLTSNIVLRVDVARPMESWGASSGAAIGRTVLVNPAAAGGPHFLAEFLLHEATHTALDCAELENPLIIDAGGLIEGTVLSPWTGNLLSLHAFLHACVVWAVLLAYWSQFEADGRADEKAKERRKFIRRGFEALDMRSLEPFRMSLSDAAFRVITSSCNIALG